MSGLRRRVLRVVPLLLFVLALVGEAKPALAAEDYYCFENLGSCYSRAAAKDSWVTMWLAGLDCELTFVHCVESALVY